MDVHTRDYYRSLLQMPGVQRGIGLRGGAAQILFEIIPATHSADNFEHGVEGDAQHRLFVSDDHEAWWFRDDPRSDWQIVTRRELSVHGLIRIIPAAGYFAAQEMG